MRVDTPVIPDRRRLEEALGEIVPGIREAKLRVTARESHVCASSHPLEIVTCSLDDGRSLRLICKYSELAAPSGREPRGGVPYEAAVYRGLLVPSCASVPALYGTFVDEETGTIGLCLEHVEDCSRLSEGTGQDLVETARWLARFHSAFEPPGPELDLSFLFAHTREDYLESSRRARELMRSLLRSLPWFEKLCRGFEEFATLLARAPKTVIHGELYPHNVLLRDGAIVPIDWESAAVAAGELDLAALTDGWASDAVADCETAYRNTRWRDPEPADFERSLAAARVFWHLRWLGDRDCWTREKDPLRRILELRRLGQEWGLL